MSEKLPLVSVVAVCYNHSKFVVECLDSIKNQTYQNIELIIMDDCSSDNSVEVINEWIKVNKVDCRFIAHEENQGLCKTLNEAINYCNGVYIQMVACDDIYSFNKTEVLVKEIIDTDEKVGVVFSDALVFGGNTPYNGKSFIKEYAKHTEIIGKDLYSELCLKNFIPAMATLIKKEVYDKVGHYDEELIYEDYDFWLRVSKQFNFKYVDVFTAEYRLHENNLHKRKKTNANYVNDYKMLRKHIGNKMINKRLESLMIHLALNKSNKSFINEYTNKINKTGFTYENNLIYTLMKNHFPIIFIKMILRLNRF